MQWKQWLTVVLVAAAAAAWAVVIVRRRHDEPIRRYLRAGAHYAALGQARKAEQQWLAATKLAPAERAAWEALGELYMATDNWAAAAGAFQVLHRLDPGNAHFQSRLAASLFRAGDEQGALRNAQEVLKRDPNDQTALIVCALLLSRMGQVNQEATYLRRMLASDPHDEVVLKLLAENLAFRHLHREARPVLASILQRNPQNAEAWALLGMCDFEADPSRQGSQRSEEELMQSLRINPLAPFPRLYLGKLYRRNGNLQHALLELETSARLAPGKRDVFYELAMVYQALGDARRAQAARERFQHLWELGQMESSLTKKCAVDPGNFDLSMRLANLALEQGNYHLARAALTHCLELKPADTRVLAALRKLDAATNGEADARTTLANRAGGAAYAGVTGGD
ncbi:MAG: tetratricopeptide repeat protein [Chthonomonadales bacterium]